MGFSLIQESKVANLKSPLNTLRKDCLGLQDELQSNMTVMSAPHPLHDLPQHSPSLLPLGSSSISSINSLVD